MRNVAALLVALALVGCAARAPSPAPVDAEFGRQMDNARVAFDRGLYAPAARAYEQALARARVMDRPAEISRAAYGVGAARFALGEYHGADSALREAEIEADKAQLPRGDILLLRAKAAAADGRNDEAAAFAQSMLVDSRSSPAQRAQGYVMVGEAALARGDLPAARSALQAAQSNSAGSDDPALLAGPAGLVAQIDARGPAPADALRAAAGFDRQAALLREAQLYGEMARALEHAGQAYLHAGDARAAADRWYRAARSAAAQGDRDGATRLARGALETASSADDPMLKQRSQQLLDEMARND